LVGSRGGRRAPSPEMMIVLHPLDVFRFDESGPAHLSLDLFTLVSREPDKVGVCQQYGGILGNENGCIAGVLENGPVESLALSEVFLGLHAFADIPYNTLDRIGPSIPVEH